MTIFRARAIAVRRSTPTRDDRESTRERSGRRARGQAERQLGKCPSVLGTETASACKNALRAGER
jgi:hypothetical protein